MVGARISPRIPGARARPDSRNLSPGKAFHASSNPGWVGHASYPRDTGVGMQRHVRHVDGGAMGVGGDSVDRRPRAAKGLVSGGVRSLDGGGRFDEVFWGGTDSPAGGLLPGTPAPFRKLDVVSADSRRGARGL